MCRFAPARQYHFRCPALSTLAARLAPLLWARQWVEIMAESARNPALQQTFIASDIAMRQGIAEIIAQGIVAGEFRHDINTDGMTIMLFALVDGLTGRKAINKDFSVEPDLPAFRDTLRRLLC
ncbi:TetR family transcriptional regulator C-terminal domain-containing protein [Erwinia mallotivora]|uniref:TetR family transcriptional regulator C-terminal domain-containing protein n=1 Tax=Erwinia mallotivora TaxID=69222 RepID=UPI0035E9F081